jgi:hypothetical protein
MLMETAPQNETRYYTDAERQVAAYGSALPPYSSANFFKPYTYFALRDAIGPTISLDCDAALVGEYVVVGEVALDEPGEIFFIAVPFTDDTPTWEQVRTSVWPGHQVVANGTLLVNISSSGSGPFNATYLIDGLSRLTKYAAFFAARDLEDPSNPSPSLAMCNFTTLDLAPQFLEGYPNYTITSPTSFNLTVSLNEPCNVTYMVLRECTGVPTVDELLNNVMPASRCSCEAFVPIPEECEVIRWGRFEVPAAEFDVVRTVTELVVNKHDSDDGDLTCFEGDINNSSSIYMVYLAAVDADGNRQIDPVVAAPMSAAQERSLVRESAFLKVSSRRD